MSFGKPTAVDAESDLALLDGFIFGQLIFLVDLVKHLLPAIVHDLFVAVAAESEFQGVGVCIGPHNYVLAIVVVKECFGAHLVPTNFRAKQLTLLNIFLSIGEPRGLLDLFSFI